MSKIKNIGFIVVISLGLSCGNKSKETLPEEPQIEKYIKDQKLKITEKSKSGLRFLLVEAKPNGELLKKGQSVKVKYAGHLLSGKSFDEGSFNFILGIGQVVPGFDEGIAKLRVGEKGILIFPSSLGYGSGGGGPIPPNSPLVFDIEVLAAHE
jgi:FKBP-type peptidyl-prolyl cis-trans isomerase